MNYHNLPNLDDCVLAALDFFAKNRPPKLGAKSFSFPIVIGSGNAYNTGKIIFGQQAALFANESDLKTIIKQYKDLFQKKIIKEAIIISASGEKDSVWETKLMKKIGLKTRLLTCSANSSAAKIADKIFIYRKLAEPYTYNVSTYLGMVLSATGEKASDIKKIITKIKLPKNFSKYSAYSFIMPDEFGAIAPMLDIKRHELFGPHLSLRAFTFGDARHAKFVNRSKNELIISLGENKYFGLKANRLEIKAPNKINSGLTLALFYYLIGKIQASKPPYYKDNIAFFCQNGPLAYGSQKPFDIIVPGN